MNFRQRCEPPSANPPNGCSQNDLNTSAFTSRWKRKSHLPASPTHPYFLHPCRTHLPSYTPQNTLITPHDTPFPSASKRTHQHPNHLHVAAPSGTFLLQAASQFALLEWPFVPVAMATAPKFSDAWCGVEADHVVRVSVGTACWRSAGGGGG